MTDYKQLCTQLVELWDATVKSPLDSDARRIEFCAKTEWIVSNARHTLANDNLSLKGKD